MRRIGLVLGLLASCGEVKNGAEDAAPPGGDAGNPDTPIDMPPPVNGTPALMVNANGGTIGLCATGTFGWHFTTQQAIEIVALSVFDVAPQGLLDKHDVGVFKLDGTLLARATVDVTTPDQPNGFHKVPIAPLPLGPNQTFVIAMSHPGQDHTTVPGTCSDVFATTDNDPAAISVSNAIIYKGVASEDTTNAPDPTALVFPNQFPPQGNPPFPFRIGASFEFAAGN